MKPFAPALLEGCREMQIQRDVPAIHVTSRLLDSLLTASL